MVSGSGFPGSAEETVVWTRGTRYVKRTVLGLQFIMSVADQTLQVELAARIAFQQRIINTWSSATNRPASIEATARSHTGSCWFDIAVCHLIDGDSSAAQNAFAQSASWGYSSLEVMSPKSLATYCGVLETAILARDHELATRLAKNPVGPEPRPSLIFDRLEWGLALPSLVTGDESRAMVYAKAASLVPDEKAWYPGIGQAIGALASNDKAGLTMALERVLAKHIRYAKAKKSWCYNSGPCLLCVPAAVLIILSAWRGTPVGEVKGSRATIPLALTHSAPGKALDIEADFIAETLTRPPVT